MSKVKRRAGYSDWKAWDPKQYLNTYFQVKTLGPDSYIAWAFLVHELKKLNRHFNTMLDFGSGPTIFSVIPCEPYAQEIHMCDYLDVNLQEVHNWLKSKNNYFNWLPHIEEVLKIEGIKSFEKALVRERAIKSKITKLINCDAGKSPPIETGRRYDLIVSTYCVESATSSKETWKIYMENLLSLLSTSGVMFLSALRNCEYYKVGNLVFPCANINEKDISKLLIENGFNKNQFSIEVKSDINRHHDDGFSGILLVCIKN